MFNVAFTFIKQQFLKVIYTIDNINIFGDFSVLDFNIALLIFGAILPIVIVTVNNWSNSSISKYENRNRKD